MTQNPTIRPARWLAVLAVALAPVLSHPAAAQRRDLSMNGVFRDDAPETTTDIGAKPADVFRTLSEVLAEMGMAMSTASNPHGLEYLTNFVDLRGRLFNRPNGEFFNCQTGDFVSDMTNAGQITFAIRARVAGAGADASVLHMQLDARARRRGTNTGQINCNTTSKLETRVAQLVQTRLALAASPDSGAAAPAAQPQP